MPEFGATAGAAVAQQGTDTLLSAILNTFAKGSVSGGLKGAVERASQVQMFAEIEDNIKLSVLMSFF